MIRCETLGPVRVTVDGRPAAPELLWRKHLALLIYLARAPRRGRSRSNLIGTLWPDKPEAAARHSLNEGLRVLRRAVAGGLETEGEQVALADGVVSLDVDDLERQVAAGAWSEAADLVLGEFLEGFRVPGSGEFETWLAAERDIWRRRGSDALVGAAMAAAGDGNLAAAFAAADRAVGLNPWSGQAVLALMKILALDGRRAEALARFDSHVARLANDLGAVPDREVEAVAGRIRRWAGGGRGTQSPADLVRRPPLVGRTGQIRALLASWDRTVARPQAEIAILTGAQGFGRSRLLEEVRTRLALERSVVVGIRAVPADEMEPGNGLAHLAAGLVESPGVAGASPAAIGALAARSPVWRERFPAAAVDSDWGLVQAFTEILRVVTAERPLALLVDDAHWLDDESLHGLAAAVRTVATGPLWIAVSASSASARSAIDQLVAQSGRDVPGVVLEPGPLGDPDISELVRWAFPHYSPTDTARLARRLARDSAGIPLLAVEMVAAVAAGMEPGAEAWPAPQRTLEQTMPGDLPPTLVAAFRVSFRRLSEAGQRALTAVAVVGGRVPLATIAGVAELGRGEAEAAVDELEWARWLESEPRGYAFVARIAREVILRDMLTAGQRERLMGRAAGLGERRLAGPRSPA